MNTSDCPFEVGKEYKTRDGRTAKVVAIVPEARKDQQLLALINDVIHGYHLTGMFSSSEYSALDLMLPEKPRRVVYQILCQWEDGTFNVPDRLFESEQSARDHYGGRLTRLLTENPIYVDGPEGKS